MLISILDSKRDKGPIVLKPPIGPVEVDVQTTGDKTAFGRLRYPMVPKVTATSHPFDALARLVGIEPRLLSQTPLVPRHVDTGVKFLFLPVPDLAVLYGCEFDLSAWRQLLASTEFHNLYMFTDCGTERSNSASFEARMFAPAMGQSEDAATGAAAGGLAAYLLAANPTASAVRGDIRQGVKIGRPSRLEFEGRVHSKSVCEIHIAGEAVLVAEGVLHLPG